MRTYTFNSAPQDVSDEPIIAYPSKDLTALNSSLHRLEVLITDYDNKAADLIYRLDAMEEELASKPYPPEFMDQLDRIEAMIAAENPPRMPKWKKVLYGAGLAFLTASTVKYWIVRAQDQPRYVVIPNTAAIAGPQEAGYGR